MFQRFAPLIILFATSGSICYAQGDFLVRQGPYDLVGEISEVQSQQEETLLDIARRFDLGFFDIVKANPTVDTWLPGEGTTVILPTRHILPQTTRSDIVVNVPELRIYHYYIDPQNHHRVRSYPVSIGRQDWSTPLGSTSIIAKHANPAWHPPQSIRDEHAEQGDILPVVVPAGPDNPLGNHALRLGIPGYLIHGTNKPYGIGMRVTHGCVRLYPEDIEELFQSVTTSTPVHIIHEPVKLGWMADVLFLEVHHLEDQKETATAEDGESNLLETAVDLIERQVDDWPTDLDMQMIRKIVKDGDGVPYPIWVRNI